MNHLKTAILLTGRPGSGKTTIVKKVAASLGEDAGGFYTEEIRESGQRQGFAIVTLSWADSLKALPRVDLVRVTEESRDSLPAALLHRLTHLEASHKVASSVAASVRRSERREGVIKLEEGSGF